MSRDKTPSALPTAYRLAVASRVAAAALGGYALASAAMVLMAPPGIIRCETGE